MKRTSSVVILRELAKLSGMQMLVVCKSVGNPDHGQYAPLSEPEYYMVDSFEQASACCRAYIEMWGLGGGNWSGGQIYLAGGVEIARVSYNGRVWKSNNDKVNAAELTFDRDGEAYNKFLAFYRGEYRKMLDAYMAQV
jgi:hypothetical protein